MAESTSNYSAEKIKEVFDFFDEDKSGTIPASELESAFLKLALSKQAANAKAQVGTSGIFLLFEAKNVLQFLLISAHNLIEFNSVSRCTYYLPTLN